MIWNVAKKEIVSNLLSYKFFVVILLTAVLIFTSFFIMHRDFKQRLSDYQLVKPTPKQPIALVPPNPLSIFVKGLDEAMARSFEVTVIGITVRAGQRSGNSVFSFFPTPDFLYIVKVALSLVALLFGFDQVSRERERGTLKLMLSNSLSRAHVLMGKWIGNYLSLSIPFFLVTLLAFVFLHFDPDIRFSSTHIVRFIFILVISLLYIALFLSLGILISTLTKKASASIVVLLFIWTIVVFVIPNLGTLFARQVIDVPSVKALNEKRQQIWSREVLLAINEVNQDREIFRDHLRTIHTDIDKMEADYRQKFNRLTRFSKNINRISPVASFIYLVSEIAGTGISEEDNLKNEIIRHKNSFIDELIAGQINEYPAFHYQYRPLSQIFAQGVLFDMTWLVFFNVIFFTVSFFSLVKYDVR